MGVYENLLPGKENALTPEYLTVKCHFSSVRMLQKQIEAERKAGKVILSKVPLHLEDIIFRQQETQWKFGSLFAHLRIEERIPCGFWRVQENFWKSWKVIRIDF